MNAAFHLSASFWLRNYSPGLPRRLVFTLRFFWGGVITRPASIDGLLKTAPFVWALFIVGVVHAMDGSYGVCG